MNKLTMTKELIKIANFLDNSKLHGEANSLTKIAEDMMDDKFDPMVYNPDDEASDDLDAKADERETRGFISITIMRPSTGLIENCTFDPPVSTPISRSTAIDALRIN